MQIRRKAFADVPQFSARDRAYATGDPKLKPFYAYAVELDAFGAVMDDKAADHTDRQLLVEGLQAQFAELPPHEGVAAQVEKLKETTTYTVVTAHQPSLFTGPLYFVYKICSAINLARQLNQRYPERHVVPVFVTGGEDHDFDEINHAVVYGNRLSWKTEAGGPVGTLSTKTLTGVLAELKEVLGDRDTARAIYARIERAYTSHATYGRATVALVHDLFADHGLVVADLGRAEFKHAFLPHVEREIFEQVSQPLVEKTQGKLEAAGFGAQAHAREINFFYLLPGQRQRIVLENDRYRVLNTDLSFSRAELEAELKAHPERFSPNVVMRPVYQEFLLPNLAYVGGGGELAYWLERKSQFAAFGLNFPMLVRRNSVLWIDRSTQKKLDKAGVTVDQLFGDVELLIRSFVEENSENELSLSEELSQLENLFQSIATKAEVIDPNLAKAVEAEHARQRKAVENLEGRIRRTEKQRFEVTINQIRALKEKLFPGNGLQERYDNFLNIYLQEGEQLLPTLIETLDPLEPGLLIIEA